jgi:hypothetical protein
MPGLAVFSNRWALGRAAGKQDGHPSGFVAFFDEHAHCLTLPVRKPEQA